MCKVPLFILLLLWGAQAGRQEKKIKRSVQERSLPGFDAISIRKAISLRGCEFRPRGLFFPGARSIFIKRKYFFPWKSKLRPGSAPRLAGAPSLPGVSRVPFTVPGRSLPSKVLPEEKQIKPEESASFLPPTTAAPEITLKEKKYIKLKRDPANEIFSGSA